MTRSPADRLARVAIKHWRRTLYVSGVVLIVAAICATRLRLDPSVVSFLPAHHRAVIDFQRTLQALGTTDQHIVLVELPGAADPSSYEGVVDDLASRYEHLRTIETVDSRLPDARHLAEQLMPYAMLMLRPDEIDMLATRLSDAAIGEAMARDRALLTTPQSAVAKALVAADPLALRSVLLSRFSRVGAGRVHLDLASGYLLAKNHGAFLVIARPRFAAHEVGSSRLLMEEARRIDHDVLVRFARKHPGLPPPRISEAGAYAIDDEDAKLIREDLIANTFVSLAGVVLLFVLAFRRKAAVVYALVPMLAAIIAAFGFAALTVRTLSAASAGFAALLAGLGIDFITVFYQRFTEERNRDASLAEAIRTTMLTTMPGIAAAALTTAGTFYAFLSTDFRGMAQMGFLTGSGILFFLVAVAIVLPALIMAIESRNRDAASVRLHAFGSQRLMRISIEHPRATIACWCAITAIAIGGAARVEFNDDAARLRPAGTAAVSAQQRAGRIFGRDANVGLLVSRGSTVDEAIRGSKSLLPLLDRLTSQRRISGYDSIAAVVPTKADQQHAIDAMRRHRDSFDAERVARSIRAAAAANGFSASAFSQSIDGLERALAVRQPFDPGAITDPSIRALLSRFLRPHDGAWYSVSYVYPPEGGWGNRVPRELLGLSANQPNIVFTGGNIVSAALREVARRDAIRSTALGLVIVFILFALLLRSVGDAALSFVPFIAGAVGMLAIMATLRIELNLLNIFAGLMIVGVATDYAVYILQRYRENPRKFAGAAIETGGAVAMAAVTTIAGYGSFAVSHYPGLRSIGYITTFGIGVSALAALTLLPAILIERSSRGLYPRAVRGAETIVTLASREGSDGVDRNDPGDGSGLRAPRAPDSI